VVATAAEDRLSIKRNARRRLRDRLAVIGWLGPIYWATARLVAAAAEDCLSIKRICTRRLRQPAIAEPIAIYEYTALVRDQTFVRRCHCGWDSPNRD